MFEELMGAFGGRLVVAVLGVGLALLCLVGILWIVRGRNGPSPFVRGGRNRQPRLQVLDAAAVDTRRRLVLVRRDDVEHLIMIGGPTDIVIESRIAPAGPVAPNQGTDNSQAMPAVTPRPAVAGPATPAAIEPSRPVQPRSSPVVDAGKAAMTVDTRTAPAAHAAIQPQPSPAAQSVASRAAAQTGADPRIPEAMRPAAPMGAAQATAQPAVKIEPVRRPAEQVAAPAADDAARLLDTARDRVFAERPVAQAVPMPSARPAAPSGENGKSLGSDFEKILEAEMANNLASRDAALIGRANRPTVQDGPSAALPGAAKGEPSLQSEVARIFGEMSATRDK